MMEQCDHMSTQAYGMSNQRKHSSVDCQAGWIQQQLIDWASSNLPAWRSNSKHTENKHNESQGLLGSNNKDKMM